MDNKDINRLIEVVADVLAEMRNFKADVNQNFIQIGTWLDNLDKRVAKLEEQQVKTNMFLSEIRTSIMKIDEYYEQRLQKLEKAVFGK